MADVFGRVERLPQHDTSDQRTNLGLSLGQIITAFKEGNVSEEFKQQSFVFLMQLASLEFEYDKQTDTIKEDTREFLLQMLGGTLPAHLSEYNVSEFDIDDNNDFDSKEREDLSNAIKEVFSHMGVLGGYEKLSDVHKESARKGLVGRIVSKLDPSRLIFGDKGETAFAEEILQDLGKYTTEELYEMSEREFSFTSSQSWKETIILIGKELGAGLEDMIRFLTSIPAGITRLGLYSQYRYKLNIGTDAEKIEAEINMKELVEEFPCLALINLLGEQGIEMIKQLGELFTSGKQGDISMLVVTIAGLLAGGAGMGKIATHSVRRSTIQSARESGPTARISGDVSTSRETRIALRELESGISRVAYEAARVDDIIAGGGLGHLTGQFSGQEKTDLVSSGIDDEDISGVTAEDDVVRHIGSEHKSLEDGELMIRARNWDEDFNDHLESLLIDGTLTIEQFQISFLNNPKVVKIFDSPTLVAKLQENISFDRSFFDSIMDRILAHSEHLLSNSDGNQDTIRNINAEKNSSLNALFRGLKYFNINDKPDFINGMLSRGCLVHLLRIQKYLTDNGYPKISPESFEEHYSFSNSSNNGKIFIDPELVMNNLHMFDVDSNANDMLSIYGSDLLASMHRIDVAHYNTNQIVRLYRTLSSKMNIDNKMWDLFRLFVNSGLYRSNNLEKLIDNYISLSEYGDKFYKYIDEIVADRFGSHDLEKLLLALPDIAKKLKDSGRLEDVSIDGRDEKFDREWARMLRLDNDLPSRQESELPDVNTRATYAYLSEYHSFPEFDLIMQKYLEISDENLLDFVHSDLKEVEPKELPKILEDLNYIYSRLGDQEANDRVRYIRKIYWQRWHDSPERDLLASTINKIPERFVWDLTVGNGIGLPPLADFIVNLEENIALYEKIRIRKLFVPAWVGYWGNNVIFNFFLSTKHPNMDLLLDKFSNFSNDAKKFILNNYDTLQRTDIDDFLDKLEMLYSKLEKYPNLLSNTKGVELLMKYADAPNIDNILEKYSRLTNPNLILKMPEFVINLGIDIEKILDICLEIERAKSSEVFQLADKIVENVALLPNPLVALASIDSIFSRNGLPRVGMLSRIFEQVYPDQRLRNGIGTRSSPRLQSTTSNNVRRFIMFRDLLKSHLFSGEKTLRAYLLNLYEGKSVIEKYEGNPESLSPLEQEQLLGTLRKLYELGVNAGINIANQGESNALSSDIPTAFIQVREVLHLGNDGNIIDRIVDLYLKPIGIDSIEGALQAMVMAKNTADNRGRNYFENGRLSQGERYIGNLEGGNLIKGFSSQYLGQILREGFVSREFLGTDGTSDYTPFDIDLIRLDSNTSIQQVAENSVSSSYGDLIAVFRNTEGNISDGSSGVERDRNKFELFSTGVLSDDHYGIRTALPSTEIDYIIYNGIPRDLSNTIFNIVKGGVYIPLVDKTGKILLTPEQFDIIGRDVFSGLKEFGYETANVTDLSPDSKFYSYMQDFLPNPANMQEVAIMRGQIFGELEGAISTLGMKIRKDAHDNSIDGIKISDTGSTGRNTNLDGDFDFDLAFSMNEQDFKRYDEIIEALNTKLNPAESIVTMANAQHKQLRIKGANINGQTMDIDILFTKYRTDNFTDTNQIIESRLTAIKDQYGEQKYNEVIAQIRLAKSILKDGGVYKKGTHEGGQGGLGGVGVEFWILNNGGNIENAFRSFFDAAHEHGRRLSREDFLRRYNIYSAGDNIRDTRVENFVEKLTDEGYARMLSVIEEYL